MELVGHFFEIDSGKFIQTGNGNQKALVHRLERTQFKCLYRLILSSLQADIFRDYVNQIRLTVSNPFPTKVLLRRFIIKPLTRLNDRGNANFCRLFTGSTA